MKGKSNKLIKILCYSLIIFLAVSAIFFSVSIYFQLKQSNERKNEITQNEKNIINMEESIIAKDINNFFSDVRYLEYILQSYDENAGYQNLEENLMAFLDSKKIYYKIRYIDVKGIEKLRINYNPNGSFASKSEELQNKANEEYFINTVSLNENQIFVSKLNLDLENNQVSLPIQPVITSSMPIFDNQGNQKGIIVLNYNADHLLEDFKNTTAASLGTVYLLNDDGYWLFNQTDTDKQWAFMTDDKKSVSFKYEFPVVWENINKNSEGTFIANNGFYVYKKINPFAENLTDTKIVSDENWRIVIFIPVGAAVFDNKVLNIFLYLIPKEISSLGLILLISIIFSILINTNLLMKMKMRRNLDALTGFYNRRSGFRLLKKLYDSAKYQARFLSICIIRIKDIKEIYKKHSHFAGDELIISVKDGIKTHIRKADPIIRVCDDIFLVALVDVNHKKAEEIWQRIEQEYNFYNETSDGKFLIKANHRIIEFQYTPNENIEKIIDTSIKECKKDRQTENIESV